MLITSDHKFNLSQLSTWHHSLSCGAYPSVNKMGIHFHSNSEWDFDQLQWLFVGTHVYRYQNPNWRLITFFFSFLNESISVGLRLGAGMQVKAPKIPLDGNGSHWLLAWCHLQLLGDTDIPHMSIWWTCPVANEVFSLCSLADVWVQAAHAGVWGLAHVGWEEVVACGLTEKEKKNLNNVLKKTPVRAAQDQLFFSN